MGEQPQIADPGRAAGRETPTHDEPGAPDGPRYWFTPSNVEQVIYGTIVITGVLSATLPSQDSAGEVLVLSVGTVGAFFLAHVYAQVLAQALAGSPRLARTVEAARRSQGMIEALVLPGVPLLLGAAGVIGDPLAINLASWFCVAQLFLWCVIVALRMRRSWPVAVGVGLLFAALAAGIVTLKAYLH